MVLVAVVAALVAGGCGSTRSSSTPATRVVDPHPGRTAHSAYGLQVSVPKAWVVQYFAGCQEDVPSGLLSIGHSLVAWSCPASRPARQYPVATFDTGDVFADPPGPPVTTRRINGLTVRTAAVGAGTGLITYEWYVPSRDASLTGMGPGVLTVMDSLAMATPEAVAAPSDAVGYQYLEGVTQVPAPGPVTVTKAATGSTRSIYAIGGEYTFSDAPGRYLIQGHDGNTTCPPVAVDLRSGVNVTAPPILCRGY